MARAKPKVKVKLVTHDTELPELGQAAHVALLTLGATGCNTWKALVESPEVWERVLLTAEQQRLIDEHPYVLQHLQRAPLRSITVCDVCGRWALAVKAPTKGAKCTLIVGCTGTLFYASKMPKRQVKVAAGVPSA
ncbi:hypothetical protein [Leucobacter sp. cx-169]|uniref:hypothetical protein n=1 Tax=Leucobacter sp. cx-169 TaxID=2770549 RepID=UPI00165DE425|nr:hypothetical protein [Leucobacter sp. cx-169]MBC9927329.1 hypothetical protein [Leucobacter sp. cx-169]